MKASQLARGYLAIKHVRLPLCVAGDAASATHSHAGETAPAAPDVVVGLRALNPGEEAAIYERARAYAIERGLAEPREGDELYEYGKALHRCLLGVVDVDSDPKQPAPFFDGGLKQLEELVEIGKDGVLTLAEMHQAYQDEVSGQVAELAKEDGFERALEELAGPHGGPFYFSMRPGLRATFTLTLARLLLTSLRTRSSSTSDSATAGSVMLRPLAKGAARDEP